MKSVALIGIVGGIIGLCIGLFFVGFGSLLGSFAGDSGVANLGWLAVAASALGIIGAAKIEENQKRAGVFMIVGAVLGFVSASIFYILPGILLLTSGVLTLRDKNKPKQES